jgi:hypothetical protein
MLNVKTIPDDMTVPVALNAELEGQLADIITSARDVAVIAEELLREFSTRQLAGTSDNLKQLSHAVTVAPRLLTATQQQLLSLMSMLRSV